MTTDFNPLGTIVREADGTYAVSFIRTVNHPIAKVWDAITNPSQVAIWLGQMKLEHFVGGLFYLKFYGEDSYHMEGFVLELDPPNLLVYGWEPTGMDPNVITWRLKDISPTQTELFLSFSKVTERATMAGAGWHLSIQHMVEVMDGIRTSFDWRQENFDELYAQYAAAYLEVI